MKSETIQKRIGARIKKLRTSLPLSQEKFSFKADIDKTYLSEVENGKRNISAINLEKIILALNVSVKEFFNDETFS